MNDTRLDTTSYVLLWIQLLFKTYSTLPLTDFCLSFLYAVVCTNTYIKMEEGE